MKIPEHLALSYLLAQLGVQQEFGSAGTTLMLAAGLLPDLDGVSILGGWRCHRKYHRVIGHGLPVTLLGPLGLAWLGARLLGWSAFLPLWCWLQVSLLAHLFSDCLFYRWDVQFFWPFSHRGLGLGLIGWNDLIPTLILYGGVIVALAWKAAAPAAAVVSIVLVALYVVWRFRHPRPRKGTEGWLTGGWTRRSRRYWRWLTGDFIT